MKLTTESLTEYIGGDMEIQLRTRGCLLRGPIKGARVEGDDLIVRFKWLAKNNGDPDTPTQEWTARTNLDYTIDSLRACTVGPIGNGRLLIITPGIGDLVVLFPPNGSKLDPIRVSGLKNEEQG